MLLTEMFHPARRRGASGSRPFMPGVPQAFGVYGLLIVPLTLIGIVLLR
jgi:hypothetical protein